MPLYRYSGNSLIDEATFIKNATGGVRAYLHAREEATPEQLSQTISSLNKAGFLAVPCEHNGKAMLEVRGFRKAENLTGQLSAMQAISGSPQIQAIKEDKIGFKEWFSKNSFMLTSIIYLAGDIAYIKYESLEDKLKKTNKTKEQREYEEKLKASGVAEEPEAVSKGFFRDLIANPWKSLGGYGYLAGSTTSLAAMLLRPDPAEDQISKAANAALTASKRAGIHADANDLVTQAAQGISHTTPLRKRLSSNYSEYMNGFFAVAGMAIARNNIVDRKELLEKAEKVEGLKDTSYFKKILLRHNLDIGLGTGTLISGTYGAIATEKAHDPSKPRATGLARIWEWMKERPLSVAANGLLVSTVIHLGSSILERAAIDKENKEITARNNALAPDATKETLLENKHTTYRLFFVIVNLIAEVIMAFSSKGHGHGVKADKSVDGSTCALVADMISRKPLEQREELIGKMAGYLADPTSLGTSKDVLEKTIRDQLAALEQNPWAAALNAKTPIAKALATTEPQQQQQQSPTAGQAVTDKAPPPEAAQEAPPARTFASKETKFADWQTAALTPEPAASIGATIH